MLSFVSQKLPFEEILHLENISVWGFKNSFSFLQNILIQFLNVKAVIIGHIVPLGADQPGPEPVLHHEGKDDEDCALDKHAENVFA